MNYSIITKIILNRNLVVILERGDLFAESTVLTGKESNNLDESQVFGVQENDYTKYLDDKTKRMKKQDMEEFILQLSSKVARNHRVSDRTLRYWQKCIEGKILFPISTRNSKKLYRIMRIKEKLIAEK